MRGRNLRGMDQGQLRTHLADIPLSGIEKEEKLISDPCVHPDPISGIPEQKECLDFIVQKIRHHEKLKYTNPPSDYRYYRTSDQFGKGKQIVHVIRHESVDPETRKKQEAEELRNSDIHAMTVRKLSIIAGIINMLPYGFAGIDIESAEGKKIQNALALRLYKIAAEISDPTNEEMMDPKKSMDAFVDHLRDTIALELNDTDTIHLKKEILAVEREFVFDYEKQKFLVHETVDPDGTIIQTDVPFGNRLLPNQMRSFQAIHDPDPERRPKWFEHGKLQECQKKWLLRMIPPPPFNPHNPKWNDFLEGFQSSAMSDIPGIKNARRHYLHYQSNTSPEKKQLSRSFRTAALSFVKSEMKNEHERDNESEFNGQQAAKFLNDILVKEERSPEAPIMVQSIVTNVFFADSSLKNSQDKALENIGDFLERIGKSLSPIPSGNRSRAISPREAHENEMDLDEAKEPDEDSQSELKIQAAPEDKLESFFKDNTSVNSFRHADLLWTDNKDNLLNHLKKRKKLWDEDHDPPDPDPESDVEIKRRRIQGLMDSIDEVKQKGLLNKSRGPINIDAYIAIYISLLIEEFDGIDSVNCKSGKDRTGLFTLIRDAMLVYWEKNKKWPGCYDNEDERKEFVAILCALFRAHQAQEAAAMNTPGSFGLKDGSKMTDDDVSVMLGPVYSRSNALAGMNKPDDAKLWQRKKYVVIRDNLKHRMAPEKELINFHKNYRSRVIPFAQLDKVIRGLQESHGGLDQVLPESKDEPQPEIVCRPEHEKEAIINIIELDPAVQSRSGVFDKQGHKTKVTSVHTIDDHGILTSKLYYNPKEIKSHAENIPTEIVRMVALEIEASRRRSPLVNPATRIFGNLDPEIVKYSMAYCALRGYTCINDTGIKFSDEKMNQASTLTEKSVRENAKKWGLEKLAPAIPQPSV